MNKKNVNFYLKFKQSQKKDNAVSAKYIKRIIPVALLLLACILGFGYLQMNINQRTDELDILIDYIENQSNIDACNEVDALDAENAFLSVAVAANEGEIEAIKSYPKPNRTVIAELIALGSQHEVEIAVSGYSALSGGFSFEATSVEIMNINRFILTLQTTDLLYSVSYSGYTFNGESYNVHVSCILDGGAGK